jgi:AcrR family transcriptional regulator
MPRTRRKDARPGEIIAAALASFAERGYAATKLEDVAAAAGISKGTIYLYFPTKDALFRAMVRHVVSPRIAAFERFIAAGADAPAPDRIRRYIEHMWEHLRGPFFPILYRLTIGELPDFPDLLRFHVQETAGRTLTICAGIIRQGVAAGEFRRVDPEATARIIHAVVIKHAVWSAHRAQVPFLAGNSDAQILRHILDFVDHALRPTHPPARRPRARRRPSA